MGNMFSSKCDMCGNIQSEDDATKLKGTNISLNGATRHACENCVVILKVAFEVGKDGLSDPIKALAAMEKKNDEMSRKVQKLEQMTSGNVLAIEDIAGQQRKFQLMNPFGSLQPRLTPALEAPSQPVVHSLPAPSSPAEPPAATQAAATEEPKKGLLGGLFNKKKKK